MRVLVCVCVAVGLWATGTALAAEPLAAPGAKATLSAEYVYESQGKKADQNDSHDWKIQRVVKLSADLVAHAPTALATMQAPDAAQVAQLKKQQAQAASAATKMAPMMADMEKIVAKCGDDEACIEKAVTSYGLNMEMTPELESAKADIAELSKAPGTRYQAWRATAQRGTYSVDETENFALADPACPGLRCKRSATRKGSGEIPPPPAARGEPALAAGASAAEIDSEKNTLTLSLPVPLYGLPITETTKSDDRDGENGTRQRELAFHGLGNEPLTVALSAGSREQSGEKIVKLAGAGADGGTLTVRWRFTPR